MSPSSEPKQLVIVGAGNFGREVYVWASRQKPDSPYERIAGFLDSRANILDGFGNMPPILGSPDTYEPKPGDVFVCAVGDSAERLKICQQLESRGFEFVSVIDPSAVIGNRVQLGPGCVLCPYVVITTDVRLGRHCHLNLHVSVGHDSILGDACTLSPHCAISGNVRLGEGVSMGTCSSVIPHCSVGEYAVIGAGAAVVKDIPAGVTAVGVPAKER